MSDPHSSGPRTTQATSRSWNESAPVRYAFAVASVASALIATLALRTGLGTPASRITFVFFYIAILVGVRLGGLGPGLLSIALATLAGNYFFLRPNDIFALDSTALLQTALFVFIALLLVILTDRSQRAEAEARASRKSLETTLKSIGDAVIATDAEGSVEFMNPVAERLTGWQLAKARGHKLAEIFRIVNEQTRATIESPVVKVLREGGIVGLANHTILVGKDGTETPIDDSGAPIKDERGRTTGVVLVFHDISERRKSEAALRQRERELTDFIENATVGLHWVGADGTILWANRAELEMLGYEADEYIGHKIVEFHADRDVIEDILERLTSSKEIQNYEARLLHKNGSIRYGLISSNALMDEKGNFVHTRCFTRDVTDSKLAEEWTARLAAIVESSDDAIIGKTLDGIITSWNDAAERMYGYAAEETIGQHISLITPDERAEELIEIMSNLKLGKHIVHLETVRAHKDGTRLDVSLTISPICDAADRPVGASTIARNITEQKRAEGRLAFLAEASEALSSSLDYEVTLKLLARLAVSAMADYCLIDLVVDDGEVRRVATAHADPGLDALVAGLRRFPPDPSKHEGVPKVLRTGKTELVPRMSEEGFASLTRSVEHRRTLEQLGLKSFMTVPLVARDRTIGALTLALTSEGRSYTPADVAFAEELARRAAFAIENARLYTRAKEVNRAKDEFLATLSHELRTPLTPIIGWTHMLRSGRLGAREAGQGLDVIEKNAQSLSRLINDLLDMSSILSGKMRIERTPMSLDAVVREAVETVLPRANVRSVALEVATADGGERVVVNGDRTRLVQVFWNLLDNAVKFSPTGGRVRVSVEGENGAARVRVEDDGAGVSRDFLPHVFERFRQADMGTTRQHGGLGIGLALVKSFVEAHGGRVEVESAGTGQGARFTVSLPAASAIGGATAPAEARPSPAAEPCPDDVCRILLIEDAPDTLEMLRLVFERRGYDTTTCVSAEEALSVAESGQFDIIVSDIGLPHIDGYELIERLRRFPHLREIPALALTGYAATKDAQAALDAGFDAHVAKPVDPTTLVAQIEHLMRRRPRSDTEQYREQQQQ